MGGSCPDTIGREISPPGANPISGSCRTGISPPGSMRRVAVHRLVMGDGARKQKVEARGWQFQRHNDHDGAFHHNDTTTGLTAGEHRNAEVDFGGLFLVLAVVEGYKWRDANGCAGSFKVASDRFVASQPLSPTPTPIT